MSGAITFVLSDYHPDNNGIMASMTSIVVETPPNASRQRFSNLVR